MQSFQYGTTTINYSIEYKEAKKDVSLSVSVIEGVKLVAPRGTSQDTIEAILRRKATWIIKKKKLLEEVVAIPKPKEYVSGEKFAYLGRNYLLKINKIEQLKRATLTFKQGRFIAEIPSQMSDMEKKKALRQLYKEWYIAQGNKKIKERLDMYCSKMDVEPTKIIFKEQKMRWGTCTSEGAIYLNWRIIMAPIFVIDYVLVHELAHLNYPNHSVDYWKFVQSILPDYEQRKEWLRKKGPTLLY